MQDDWEEIYKEKERPNGVEYLTYGGGPSGGYYVHYDGELMSWHQDWFTPTTYTSMKNKQLEFKTDDNVKYCRVIEVPETLI